MPKVGRQTSRKSFGTRTCPLEIRSMTKPFSEREGRLDEIIAGYLAAVENGNAPATDELVARHREFGPALREFLADKLRIDEIASRAFVDEQMLSDEASTLGQVPRAGLPAAVTPAAGKPVAPGKRFFGDYELLEELGRGGMGVVFRARQVNLNRTVALKMILAGRLASAAEVRRFKLEAEAAAGLEHPGIVPVFEIGEHDGQHFFSMAYVEGRSLAQQLADGPLPAGAAARMLAQIAVTMAFAHQRGVIHRDLKPGNILLDHRDQPRVVDFGLARRLSVDSSLTGSGQLVGTPNYMSPEQITGGADSVAPAADIYALGGILYCMLTGHPPFQAATPAQTMSQAVAVNPLAPHVVNPAVPRDLSTICLKCLHKAPGDRYATSQDLADDLGRFLEDLPIRARPLGRVELARRWLWKRRRKAASVAGVVLGTLAFVGAAWSGWAAWRSARQGELVIESAGPALKAELFLDGTNQPACEAFTIPTSSPGKLAAGRYRLLVSAPGRIGHSTLITVPGGGVLPMRMELQDQAHWPEVSLAGQESVRAYAAVVPFSVGADLVLVDPRDGVSRRRPDGSVVWKWNTATGEGYRALPPRMSWERWAECSAETCCGPWHQRPVASLEDVNGDGEKDFCVWSKGTWSASPGGLIVFSGLDGKPLWSKPEVAGEEHLASPPSRSSQSQAQTSLSAPLIKDVDHDGIADLLVIEVTGRTSTSGNPSAAGADELSGSMDCRVVAWSGKDGSDLWSTRMAEAPPSRAKNGTGLPVEFQDGVLHLVQSGSGQEAVAWFDGLSVRCVDLLTGNLLGENHLPGAQVIDFCFVDLDGDARDDFVCLESVPQSSAGRGGEGDPVHVAGYSMVRGTRIMESALSGAFSHAAEPNANIHGNARPRISSVDLDSDGRKELLIQTATANGSMKLSLVDVSGFAIRWEHQLRGRNWLRESNERMLAWECAAGPDLNGDAVADLVVATCGPGTFREDWSCGVLAVCGRTGAQLWQVARPIATGSFTPMATIGELVFHDEGPDGLPLVVASFNTDRTPPETLMLTASEGLLWKTVAGAMRPLAVDLDGDGMSDLVWMNQPELDYPRAMPGSGLGAAPSLRMSRGVHPDKCQMTGDLRPASRAGNVDFDGDGYPDFLQYFGSGGKAVSGRNGDFLWTNRQENLASATSHRSFQVNEDGVADVFVIQRRWSDCCCSALSGADGRELWQRDLATHGLRLLEFRAFSRRKEALLVLEKDYHDEENGLRVQKISNQSGELVWDVQLEELIGAGGQVSQGNHNTELHIADLNRDGTDDALIAFADWDINQAQVVALDGANGHVLWRQTRPASEPDPVGEFRQLSVVRTTDLEAAGLAWLVFENVPDQIDEKARVIGLDPEKGDVVWECDLESAIYFPAQVLRGANGTFRLASLRRGDRVGRLSGPDGAESVEFALPDPSFRARSIKVVDVNLDGVDELLFTTFDSATNMVVLYLVDSTTGKLRWKWTTAGRSVVLLETSSQPSGQNVCLPVLVDEVVYGIDLADGVPVWRCEGPETGTGWRDYYRSAPVVNRVLPQILDCPGPLPLVQFQIRFANAATINCFRRASAMNNPANPPALGGSAN